MRFLISLSSVIMAASGAFCFAFYMNGYAGVAFVLGAAMLIYGLCHVIAYSIGFRKSILPETVLVEGLFGLAFGFLIITNLIPEKQILLFYGAWLCLSGLIRFSESLAVSKVNPKNWFAVAPLGIVCAMSGFLMMVPNLLAGFDSVYIVAISYIVNALSIAVYSVYMIKRQQTQKAKEAKERAEAKKRLAEVKRKERDRLRSLTEAEREKEIADAKAEKLKQEEAKKAEKEARKEARRPATERTVEFTQEETEEINRLAEVSDDDEPIKASDIWSKPSEEELQARPVFNKPTNIPVIEKQIVQEEKEEDLKVEEKRSIVNLEELEEKVPEVELPSVEIPKVELKAEGGESLQRKAFLLELEKEEAEKPDEDELASFKPLSLEDLFSDEEFNIKPLSDEKAAETDLKLTQSFTFDWLDIKK
ncbi:MAG: hypothetical protein Q4F55_01290 [Bacillota bacterium]|nr:hypothetical protein [Bacillota bacterium]